jgi:hypothetical protein
MGKVVWRTYPLLGILSFLIDGGGAAFMKANFNSINYNTDVARRINFPSSPISGSCSLSAHARLKVLFQQSLKNGDQRISL